MANVPLSVRPESDEPGAAQLFVTARVAGHPYDFLLDTGAARSRVRDDDHTRRFAVEDSPSKSRGALGPGVDNRRARVPSIEFGPIVAQDVIVDLGDETTDGPTSILGLDVLAGHRLDVLTARGQCTVDAEQAIDGGRTLVLSSHNHPHMIVEWPTASAVAIYDTGASVTIVDTDFAQNHPSLFVPHRNSTGTDANGNQSATAMVIMQSCRIGEREFSPSLAAIAPIAGIQPAGDPPFDLILGYPIISQAGWAVDFGTGTWGFLR